MAFDYIVKDSTIWHASQTLGLAKQRDATLKVGIVRKQAVMSDDDAQVRYEVEVTDQGNQIALSCVLLTRFGGVYNYEEFAVHGYSGDSPLNALQGSRYAYRAGDMVICAYINGDSREGVILGGLQHPARSRQLEDDQIAYVSEFNGIETRIMDDGTYTLTFKGVPVNAPLLETPPIGAPIPEPQYNPLITGSMFMFDTDGSIILSDAHPVLEQIIKIDKGGNTINITSGPNLAVAMGAADGSLAFNSLTTKFDSTTSFDISTVAFGVEASTTVKIKGTQIAIGSDGCELIDTLIKLIDALGTLIVTSPVGPCQPLQGAPTWPQIIQLKLLLSAIKGSL